MLTDIFADRYATAPITYSSYQSATRFLVQASRMITEQIFPLFDGDEDDSETSIILKEIHSRLSMELGLDQLTASSGYPGPFTIRQQTSNFFKPNIADEDDFDNFLKERLSFIELAFREFEIMTQDRITAVLKSHLVLLDAAKHLRIGTDADIPMLQEGYAFEQRKFNTQRIQQNLHELSERFRKAGFPLTYNDGFIQISDDELVAEQIKRPFWSAISDSKWSNVAIDMHEAIDRRDNRRPEAALSAAKALESAIKIVAHDRNATTGREKGAMNFVEALAADRGGNLLAAWEVNVLRNFFGEVRNRLGHGAGLAEATVLTKDQDDWAIETCMSWIKSLVSRTVR
ncbi:AbiJ-NTD4 domain-containing protein [Agrobacterium rosae]|uniref:AbiJ-NTD4 domain-containing protein n=1 Tax=Agrobacterium rosae TaxID=1972867 RepID=UPI0020347048|nr:hypothetical protein [Agrobacterium rosae]MCM2433198.1 hypothetical protein [Agrobacterium rosae]